MRHPSEYLSSLAEHLRPLLAAQPRLLHFSAEREFVVAQRRWKDRVKSLRLELDRVPEDAREDNSGDWWDYLSNIIGILEGRAEIIEEVCLDFGGDWKEVCVAWGIFVDHRLRRQDLPSVLFQMFRQPVLIRFSLNSDVVGKILDVMPPDLTDLEDNILAGLFCGRPADALSQAAKHDRWLAAHWADLMESLDLVDAAPDEEYVVSHWALL
jgi:nuclear pore complex protein Nup85